MGGAENHTAKGLGRGLDTSASNSTILLKLLMALVLFLSFIDSVTTFENEQVVSLSETPILTPTKHHCT